MNSPASTTAPWDAKRPQSKSGRLRQIISWMLGLGVLCALAYGMKSKPVETEMGIVTTGPLRVEVVEEGKTRVRNRYTIAAPVAGQMQRVTLKAGDAVEAGKTVITTIEPSAAPLLDPRAQATAHARVSAADAALSKAREAAAMAQTAALFAKQNWDRVRATASSGSVSITERENAERDAEMRDREVRADSFAINVAEFELAQAKASLSQFTDPSPTAASVVSVHSPVHGQVLRVLQESSMVVPSGTLLVEVGDPQDLEIEAEMLSRDAVVIKPGALVSVEQWGGEAPLEARVRRVEPAAFTKVSALGVEEQRVIVLSDLLKPPAAAQALGDRYRVEVRIAIWGNSAVLQVPAGALFREGGEWATFIFHQGTAHKVKLEAGHSNGRATEILHGLIPGQQVLLHPPDTIKEGTPVILRAE